MKSLTNTFFIVIFTMMLVLIGCSDDDSNNVSGSTSCTVFENDKNAYTIECPDGTSVTIHDGVNGKDGQNGKDGVDGANGSNGKDGENGQEGTSSIDTLVSNNTSCTIKDNEDSTYTIVCPDGTSAIINNRVVGGIGVSADYNTTTITLSNFELTYNTSKLLYIYDYKKYALGMEDDAVIKIYSTSDTEGVTVKAVPSALIASYYEVYYYIVPGKSHDNYVHAKDGDTIYFRYNSEYGHSSSITKKVWDVPNISTDGLLSVSKKICYGDSAKISVTLFDADLTSESIQLPLTINGVPYKATLEGGLGYYSAVLMFARNAKETEKNVYLVKDTARIVVSYEDASSGNTVSDDAKWVFFTKGTIMFDDDAESFNGSRNVTVYLYDNDNSKSSETVWVKNEKSGDSLKVTLSKYDYSYFYGSFYVNNQKTNGHLYVPDTTYITVSYYDESVKETVIEQSLMQPKPYQESVSLRFMLNRYFGVEDKAQIQFSSSNLTSESFVTFTITSTSDSVGYKQEATYFSSYRLDNGLVGFTTGKTQNGFIHVTAKDTVYATYVSESGEKYVAKTVWEP